MTIGKKIIGGYAIVLASLAVVVAVSYYSLNITQNAYNEFIDVRERLVNEANELRFETRDRIAHYRAYILYPGKRAEYLKLLEQNEKKFEEVMARMRMLILSDSGRVMLDEILVLNDKHWAAIKNLVELDQQGKVREMIEVDIREVRPISDELVDKAEVFRDRQSQIVTEGRADVTATISNTFLAMGIISLIGILITVFLSLYLTGTITRTLKESTSQLSSSASEIVAMTTQVAAGASETATAVSETTTTVEEVKQTAQVSSQKAKTVSDSAQKAAQVSQLGKKSVEQTIEGMTHIREQMESVADSIVRLSEQSQAIGEIISSVNDLAEQSNLLAVNAAIEAAKAGEQGKGFAVVAQEVKSLAEQSKQATAQVRTILMDVQKATSAAVMAAEQGSKAVEAGVRQSAEAGDAIKVLSESMVEAAQSATQIAASSQQQLVGMDQVALAMENIKQASTQNAASTKQAEQAAQNLHELGQKLKQLVDGGKNYERIK
jgi:methyl-accepting chemotaxis protein